MARKDNEVRVTFRAFNKEFNDAIKAMNQEARKLRQEMRLQQEQMKLTGSESDKLRAQVANLEKQYEIAQQKTRATAEQLEKVKQQWGENSQEASKLENQLRSNQIAEQQLANRIAETTNKLREAERAERERASESAIASRKLEELERVEERLANTTDKLNAEYELAKATLGDKAKETDKLKIKVEHLGKQHEVAKMQVKNYEEQLEQAKRKYGENSVEVDKYETKLLEARTAERNLANEIKQTNKALSEQSNVFKRAGKNLTDLGKRMQDIGRNLSLKITTPIVAGGAAMFKASMDFESAFAGVAKTFSGTEQQLENLREGIRQMAKEIPASTTEIAAVAEAAGQLGIEATAIEKFTRTMIDLGEATNMTAETAATEFARFANIVQMSQKNFDRLGSSVVALGNSMATTEAEISSMAMRLAAQGKQVGMTEAQIMALAATMSSLGIEAEAGGTAMTTVLKKMQTAVMDNGAELRDWARTAHMSVSEFKKLFEEDAIGALDALIKGLAKSASEGENLSELLADIGIKGIRESDTMMRLAGASNLLADAVKTSTEAWEENTALTEEAEQRYKTTESRLRILWNRAKDMAITLGDTLVPAVMSILDMADPLIEKIESAANAFSEMDEKQKKTILTIAGIVAGAGPAMFALGSLASSIGALSSALTMFANPAGIAIAGIGALAGGALYLANELNKPTFAVDLFGDTVSDATKKAVGSFMELNDKAEIALKELHWSGQAITKATADEIVGNFSAMKDSVVNALNEQKNETLASLQEMFVQSTNLSEEEKQKMLEITHEMFDERIKKTEEGQARIVEIVQKGLEEGRKTTQAEWNEINRIREEMLETGIMMLSESEAEQLVILERLKTESEKITAEQAAAVVKNSIEQRDQTIQAAEEEYNDRIKLAILLREEGTKEAKEMADKIIEEAIRQRDETIAEAEKMHENILSIARAQAGEYADLIFWTSGEIMTHWDKLALDTVRTTTEMWSKILNKTVEFVGKASEKWKEIRNVGAQAVADLKDKATSEIRKFVSFVSDKFNEARDKIVNPIERARDKVEEATKKIVSFFSNMKLKIPKIQMPKLPRFTIEGNFNFNPPSVPKLKVHWNAKGGIFTRPTIFNTANAGLQGVGEAGPEAIIPLRDDVLGKIGEMIAATITPQSPEIIIEAGDVYIDGEKAGKILWKPVKQNIDRNDFRSNKLPRGR